MRSGVKVWIVGAALAMLAGAAVVSLLWRGKESPTPAPIDPPVEPQLFEDVTVQSGIDFTYRNGEEANHYAILESLGGGVALIDYDGDGLLDIFLTGGGYFDGPDRKQIQGTFLQALQESGRLAVPGRHREVGLDTVGGQPWFYTHGAAVADYDNDGWPDLLVTGYGRLALFHNVKR